MFSYKLCKIELKWQQWLKKSPHNGKTSHNVLFAFKPNIQYHKLCFRSQNFLFCLIKKFFLQLVCCFFHCIFFSLIFYVFLYEWLHKRASVLVGECVTRQNIETQIHHLKMNECVWFYPKLCYLHLLCGMWILLKFNICFLVFAFWYKKLML